MNVDAWQYKGKRSWHDFDQDIHDVVNAAFGSNRQTVEYCIGGQGYTIDFATMKQRCTSDPSRARDVRPPRSLIDNDDTIVWQHKGRNHWQDFPAHVNDQVESAYAANQVMVEYVLGGDIYEIDFDEMKQRCMHDPSRSRCVRRLGGNSSASSPKVPEARSSIDSRPGYWDLSISGAGCARLPCDAAFVKKVQQLFTHTHNGIWTRDRHLRAGRQSGTPAGFTVMTVWRLQDNARWNTYFQRRAAISSACHARPHDYAGCCKWRVLTADVSLEATELDKQSNEHYLFHGAPQASIEAIVNAGIDTKKARSDGLLGGNKIYLAENSTKADEYTGIDSANHFILICRAVLGIYRYTEDAAPDKAALDADLQTNYHSIWAHRRQTTGLNEIAIADATQVYPEYLVHYTRK